MPIIRPISDLRNKASEISKLVHQSKEPVFITKNGEGDMVVMSMACYGQLQVRLDLYAKLAEAQRRIAAGDRGRPLREVVRDLRRVIDESR
jgi:prevent-host-death family protein